MLCRSELSLHRGQLADAQKRAARHRLVRDVLGVGKRAADRWQSFCYFAGDGSCVANLEATVLPLFADGARLDTGAIRAIAVDPAWRGQGLFRDLMSEALAWADGHAGGATLLYTAEPELYRRFGFASVPQHAFVGAAPEPEPRPPARRLDPRAMKDAALIREAIERRTPVSIHCALLIDEPSFAANLVQDGDLKIAHTDELDAVIVYETDGGRLTLVDIIAGTIPPLAAVIGALALSPRRVQTLFPPDQLGWDGTPVAEDTGLMLRGTAPKAMARPFMFPPTSEF